MTAQHFLVPIDFSDYADQALDYAMALGQNLQARLTLLHVIHAVPLWAEGDMGRTLPDVYLAEVEAAAQRGMEQRRQRVQDAGLEANVLVVHGVPFQTIIDVAQEAQIDLIIMGTHGRTGMKHMLLGSVAEKVVRLAPCPVLVTRGSVSTPNE
jgi:nucleotide-binding universal stress UspA family protein